MASLTVGGVAIKVAVSSPRWTRMDAVDRARAFDNTFRASQTGGAVRVWDFETPPVLAVTEGETYKAALSAVASQLCSGDIIAIPTMCSAELTDGVPTSVAGDPYVVLSFSLHEVQPAKVLLRYSPGDTITGESFTRSTTATYINPVGVIATAAINVKRESHSIGASGQHLLLEGARTNDFTKAQELDDAAWTKTGCTISANAGNGPDGTATADAVIESALNEDHYVLRNTPALTASTTQAFSFFAQASTRSWIRVVTADKAGTVRQSWFNLTTGLFGTVNAGHTIRATALASGWYRMEVVWSSGVGAGTPFIAVALATADLITAYAGTGASGLFMWGFQFETDKPFCSSYIPTTTAAVTRGADSYSLPFTTPPQEMTVYAKFVEGGTTLTVATPRLFSINSAGGAAPQFLGYANGPYHAFHANGSFTQDAALALAPALGDMVEIGHRLFGDGSVDITQSVNSGAATSGAQTGALPLNTAWSAQLCWLNSGGSGNVGFTALKSFKIVAGARSLTELRAL